MRSGLSKALRSIGAIGDKLRPKRPPRPPGDDRRPPRRTEPDAASPDTELGRIRISYEPSLDGDPDPGEVVWAWVPYEEDPTQGKDRPVVVIGRHGRRLAAVALTTRGHDHPDNVFLGTGRWDPQQRDSWAKLDRILQLDPDGMRREGAILDRRRFDELANALRRHHGVSLPSRPRE